MTASAPVDWADSRAGDGSPWSGEYRPLAGAQARVRISHRRDAAAPQNETATGQRQPSGARRGERMGGRLRVRPMGDIAMESSGQAVQRLLAQLQFGGPDAAAQLLPRLYSSQTVTTATWLQNGERNSARFRAKFRRLNRSSYPNEPLDSGVNGLCRRKTCLLARCKGPMRLSRSR